MEWVPRSGWLTQVTIDASAAQLEFDLAVSATGGQPSRLAAGFDLAAGSVAPDGLRLALALVVVLLGVAGVLRLVAGPPLVAPARPI